MHLAPFFALGYEIVPERYRSGFVPIVLFFLLDRLGKIMSREQHLHAYR